jgi:hypothetical protein
MHNLGRLLALSEWKGLPGLNALDYFASSSLVFNIGVYVVKLFTAVIYKC